MPGNTKNIGQVSGVFLGSTPPSNTSLIWYDTTPSQRCHKVYDESLSSWVIIDQNIVSAITYSELVNLANGVGLSVAKFYMITDRGNVLAMSITATKVQYCDELGNILIDDLGTNIQYHVTSSNLQIDDIAGVFDVSTKTLVFRFDESVPDMTANDFLLGKRNRNNVWSLVKYRLSTFLSNVSGNSISWNGGFFFNFNRALQDKMDVEGGVVSHETYEIDKDLIQQSIENVGSENQSIIRNAQQAIEDATTDAEIYSKEVPPFETGGEPTDVAFGDTLLTIVSKFYRWVSKFKIADGIKLTNDFTESQNFSYINNQDNVDSAFRKIQYWFKHLTSSVRLSSGWTPDDYRHEINQVEDSDTIDEAFAKLAGKFDQIGFIENGLIESRKRAISDYDIPRTEINLEDGEIVINDDDDSTMNYISLSKYGGIVVANNGGGSFNIKPSLGVFGVNVKTNHGFSVPIYESEHSDEYYQGASSFYIKGIAKNPDYSITSGSAIIAAAITAECEAQSGFFGDVFDAYFKNFKAGGLSFGHKKIYVSSSDAYLTNESSLVTCRTPSSLNLYLPPTPHDGQFMMICQTNSSDVNVYGNGHDIWFNSQNNSSIQVGGFNHAMILVFHPNIIGSISGATGVWIAYRI